jgi:hypothetical protein
MCDYYGILPLGALIVLVLESFGEDLIMSNKQTSANIKTFSNLI